MSAGTHIDELWFIFSVFSFLRHQENKIFGHIFREWFPFSGPPTCEMVTCLFNIKQILTIYILSISNDDICTFILSHVMVFLNYEFSVTDPHNFFFVSGSSILVLSGFGSGSRLFNTKITIFTLQT